MKRLLLVLTTLLLLVLGGVSCAPPAPAPAPDLFLDIESVTSPVTRGSHATLTAQTLPNADCSITVYYKSGPSKAQGLYTKKADTQGMYHGHGR